MNLRRARMAVPALFWFLATGGCDRSEASADPDASSDPEADADPASREKEAGDELADDTGPHEGDGGPVQDSSDACPTDQDGGCGEVEAGAVRPCRVQAGNVYELATEGTVWVAYEDDDAAPRRSAWACSENSARW